MRTFEQGNWSGCQALVAGLGLHGGGVAAARWLAEQGAAVSVTDLANEGGFAGSFSPSFG